MQKSIFYRLIELSVRHTGLVVILTGLISLLLGYAALGIKIDPDVWDLVPRQSEALRLLEKYGRDVSDDYLIVTAESGNLFSLAKLRAFEQAILKIESIPHIQGSINPFNFISFRKQGKRITLEPMSRGGDAPQSQEELVVFREKLLSDPIARNFIISRDLTALCAIFPAEPHLPDYRKLLSAVDAALEDLKPHFTIHLAGQIPIVETTKRSLIRDLPTLLGLVILVILLVFFIGFKSKRSVALPLILISLGTLWTAGIMSLLGYKITIISIMVPPLVLTLGSSYSIHILNQYYREALVSSGDRGWIIGAVTHINKTIALAALTTMIGFGSLLSAKLRQIREFGISISLGIIICALLSLFVYPALLNRLRTPNTGERDRVLKGSIALLMERLSEWVIKWRPVILAVVGLIVLVFGLSLKNIRYQTDYLSYFKKREKVVQDNLYVMKKFGGFVTLYVSLDAPEGRTGYFLEPEILKRVADFEAMLSRDPDIVYAYSFATFVKSMNLAGNNHFEIPDRRAPILLLSRYFRGIASTASGKALTGLLVNKDFTRLTIALRIYDSEKQTFLYEDKLKALKSRMEQTIQDHWQEEAKPVIWGGVLVSLTISEIMTADQVNSIFVSIFLVLLVTTLSFRSLKFGLLSLIPMLTGIMLNFTFMNLLQIPFDVVTIMFSSVAVGVGIDDSIHLIIQYRKYRALFPKDKQTALAHTLKSAGRPILLTSVSLIVGLAVLAASSFRPIMYFGILVSFVLWTTTVGALVILPAVLSLGKD